MKISTNIKFLNMKKILSPKFLLIFLISFIFAFQAEAAFRWDYIKSDSTPLELAKPCSLGTYVVASECNEIKKPAEKNGYNMVCCKYNEVAEERIKEQIAVIKEQSDVNANGPKFVIPDFQVKIPGLDKLSEVKCENGECKIYWIAEYTAAVYSYGLTVVGIIAVLFLMAAGLLWIVSGGDSNKIAQAKKMILGSVTGLLLMVALNMVLTFINPELVKPKAITLAYIERIELEGDNNSPTISLDATKIAESLGIKCGQDSVSQIVNKIKGKATYSQEKRTKQTPEGYVYLDCSSFANFVLKCATGKNSGQRSADIFSEQKVWDQKLESLKPGDMVGWAPKNNKSNSGHVIIYMGNGVFGDCHGGEGKKPGNCVSNSMSFDKVKKYANSHSDGKIYLKRY
jgi:hypothetical protein